MGEAAQLAFGMLGKPLLLINEEGVAKGNRRYSRTTTY
jgi:hypothetical protein